MKADPGGVGSQDLEGHLWDVIVIGAGAGGATAGFNLARLGRSVLFVERGRLLHHEPAAMKGVPFSWTGNAEAALTHGWWPRPLFRRENEDADAVPERAPFGCGAGGSTSQFNAVLDRFRPQDFTPRRFFAGVPETTLPEAWPISYNELEPFYAQAESLYRVRGTKDPLASFGGDLLDPPMSSDKEVAVFDALKSAGLHPYRIHSALERAPGCDGCPGMLCRRSCRNDAARICLYPALDQYGAKILSDCRAVQFEGGPRVVERVVCVWNERPIALRARIFIVAANAFLTPALLQRSANDNFPDGLANSSGLVGHNLMFHAVTHLFMRVKKRRRAIDVDLNHGVALNDFYVHNGTKLGNFHAHPIVSRDEMTALLAQYHGGRLLPGRILRLVSAIGKPLNRSWTMFTAIVEDLPYHRNAVAAKSGSDEDIVYTYRYPEELRYRAQTMTDGFQTVVASQFDIRPLQPSGIINGSHVCGTCRFGGDPRTSVLDRDNRAHDLDNLYVLDASFFPSSGGINPSLTIIANSLRVTDKIARRL